MNKGVVIISAVVAMFGSVALADKAVSDMIISEAEYELCQVHPGRHGEVQRMFKRLERDINLIGEKCERGFYSKNKGTAIPPKG